MTRAQQARKYVYFSTPPGARKLVQPGIKICMTSLRVLLVDDSGEILEVTRLILEMRGFDVAVARNPEEALVLARHHPFQAAIVDYGLGRENGAFLARDLKLMRPGLKVVLTSGMDMIPPEQMAMADAYYMKGDFSATDLAEILHRLIGDFGGRMAG
jgi:DNA-binding NtrC family response regulator